MGFFSDVLIHALCITLKATASLKTAEKVKKEKEKLLTSLDGQVKVLAWYEDRLLGEPFFL